MARASSSQFIPLRSLLRLLRRYDVDPKYRKRARGRVVFSLLTTPFRLWERVRYGRLIRNTRIPDAPVFLLGFGRSGTTHLHNLFWQAGFGIVSNYQAALHPIALTGRGRLERFFAGQMPKTRPMDNVALSLDGPQEEEMAMLNASEHAPLHFMSFPREVPDLYERYVGDLGQDEADLRGWSRAYLEVLKKATILSGGRRLALKTPPNTGRIPVLQGLFPDARFVHIVRNPYPVYQSMRNMYRKVLPGQVLQEFDWETIDAWVLEAYRRLMTKYLEDRKHIAPERLFEVRYEDLDERPLEILERIYHHLELGDFGAVRPQLETYLAELGTFEKNVFEFPREIVEAVNENWGFAFEAFGYQRLDPGQAPATPS
jgi:hypothetical protein